MALNGYIYALLRHKLNIEQAHIYSSMGADETPEGFEHSFNALCTLILFIIISLTLLILIFIEWYLRKKYSRKNTSKTILPFWVKSLHTIVLLIGLWFPISRLSITILLLILYPFLQ